MTVLNRAALAAVLTLACAQSPLAQPAGGSSATAAPKAAMVMIQNFHFMAMTTTVAAGGSVTWKNLDGEPHTVTSSEGVFRSAALDEGDSFTFTFTKPGVYSYLCSIHPQMIASVVVQ